MAKKQKTVNVAAATAVAAVTAAGFLVGGAYSSPEEILTEGPDVIVQTLDTAARLDDAPADGPDGGVEEEEYVEEEEEKRGVYTAVRKVVRSAPKGVRAAVGIPLWALGTVLTTLASALWSSILSPAVSAVLSWIGIALMAVLIFALTVKTVFPDLPLKKILNKRSILSIGILCLLFGIADAVLPFFWEDYQTVSGILRIVGSLVCTAVPVLFFLRRHHRKEKLKEVEAEVVAPPEEPPEEAPRELTLEEKEAAARALVEDLAASVSRK